MDLFCSGQDLSGKSWTLINAEVSGFCLSISVQFSFQHLPDHYEKLKNWARGSISRGVKFDNGDLHNGDWRQASLQIGLE